MKKKKNDVYLSWKFLMQAIMTSGESEIASLVIKESEEEGEDARKFLEEVRVSFPQVYKDKSLSMISSISC